MGVEKLIKKKNFLNMFILASLTAPLTQYKISSMKFNITLKNITIKLIFLFCINCINGFHVSVIQVGTFSILYQYIIFFSVYSNWQDYDCKVKTA